VLKERLVVLEKQKVSTPQEISDEFMDRQEQQPIHLKKIILIPELKVEMSLESFIGDCTEMSRANSMFFPSPDLLHFYPTMSTKATFS
jgi:hypothetical protein